MARDPFDRSRSGLPRALASPNIDSAPLDRTERAAAVFGGGLLVHWGLRHGGLLGLLGAAAGGTLAYMGIEGRGVRFDERASRSDYGPARRERFGLDERLHDRPAPGRGDSVSEAASRAASSLQDRVGAAATSTARSASETARSASETARGAADALRSTGSPDAPKPIRPTPPGRTG